MEKAIPVRCDMNFETQAQENVPRLQDQNREILIDAKVIFCYELAFSSDDRIRVRHSPAKASDALEVPVVPGFHV